MNCGLSNLDTLRKACLPTTMMGDGQWDTRLIALAQMVTGLFEQFTNRKLVYSESADDICTANRSHWTVRRYPLVAVESVELEPYGSVAYSLDDEPMQFRADSGLVKFSGTLGSHEDSIIVTYEGGYWVEFAEPEDNVFPTPVPAGATLIDPALQGAFFMQVQMLWTMGNEVTKPTGPFIQVQRESQELMPSVRAALTPFIRYALS